LFLLLREAADAVSLEQLEQAVDTATGRFRQRLLNQVYQLVERQSLSTSSSRGKDHLAQGKDHLAQGKDHGLLAKDHGLLALVKGVPDFFGTAAFVRDGSFCSGRQLLSCGLSRCFQR